MKKGFILWLLNLMLISLTATFISQFFWIKNPLQMNNEMFSKIVNESLSKAVLQYEINQDIRTIYGGISSDTVVGIKKSPPLSKSMNRQSSGIGNINKYPASTVMDTNLIKSRPWEGSIILRYQKWNVRRPVDSKRLRIIIEDALKQMGINYPFNYAIFSFDRIIETDLTDIDQQYWYKTKLFADDIFSRDLYLGVCFPGIHLYLNNYPFIKDLSIISSLLVCIAYYLSFVYIARQKKSSAMKTDFINHITHEFKTPITTIGLVTDSFLADDVTDNKERIIYFTQLIKEENRRMNDLVERLLQVARLDRKELYFRSEEINIHDLINKAINGILIQIEKRGGKIDKKFEAINPIISTDPTHFINLVNNLLDNANKYSPDIPQILVSTSNDQKGVYITVEDKGLGISKRIQSKIFNKFYRMSTEDIDTIKGFGLGLSYIKAIVKFNKGKIKVYSESGKGSRFVVFLPYFQKRH